MKRILVAIFTKLLSNCSMVNYWPYCPDHPAGPALREKAIVSFLVQRQKEEGEEELSGNKKEGGS